MIPTQNTNMEAANRIKHAKVQDTQRFLILVGLHIEKNWIFAETLSFFRTVQK